MFKKLKQKLIAGDNIYFFRMFRFAKPHMIPFAIGQFFYSAQGFVFSFAMSVLTGNIMAAMVAGSRDMVMSAVMNFAIMLIVFMVLLGTGLALYIYYRERIMQDVKQLLFRTFMRSGIEEATEGHSGEGVASINTDANTASSVFGQPLTNFLSNIIIVVGAPVVIFSVDWRLGIASTGVGALSFLFQLRFTKPLAEIGTERLAVNAETVKTASNIINGSVTIRAYNTQPKALLTFDKDNGRMRLLDFKRAIIDTWRGTFSLVEIWLSLVVTFAFGGWLVATGRLEFHLLMIVFGMFASFVNAIGSIGGTYAELQVPIAGVKRIFAVLDKGDVLVKDQKEMIKKKAEGYKLTLDDLTFAYQGQEKNALNRLNLEINENELVAFVGESGSGKSTLLRTIIGLYDRDDLGMNIGGVNFNDSTSKDWRENFAYVDQSCKLFDMTIRENIAMGKGGQAETEEIHLASKRAVSHAFITDLVDGYETPCGEKGASLSGGQKQRIAIARALVKKAPILVFDEATSALDTESERSIMETIKDLRFDHTVLIVTHNLHNITTADKIVVLKDGAIVEIGTHAELSGKNGAYSELLSKQERLN